MLDVIRSILLYSWRSEEYIIFVRYLMGTAYLPAPFYKISYHFFALIVPKTNLKFFLDVNPKEAATRIYRSRQKQEMFEDIDELKKVRTKALSLAYSNNWKIINSNKPAIEVSTKIKKIARL
jgi:thymidylate kinase